MSSLSARLRSTGLAVEANRCWDCGRWAQFPNGLVFTPRSESIFLTCSERQSVFEPRMSPHSTLREIRLPSRWYLRGCQLLLSILKTPTGTCSNCSRCCRTPQNLNWASLAGANGRTVTTALSLASMFPGHGRLPRHIHRRNKYNSRRFARSPTMPRRFSAPICFLSLLLSAALPVLAKQSKADSDADISQTLQAMERAWLNAEKNHDAATFDKLVADDWVAITPDGKRQTKAERAAEIKTSDLDSVTMGDMKVRVFGDTAVVTGSDDETTMKDGKKSTDHYVWTDEVRITALGTRFGLRRPWTAKHPRRQENNRTQQFKNAANRDSHDPE